MVLLEDFFDFEADTFIASSSGSERGYFLEVIGSSSRSMSRSSSDLGNRPGNWEDEALGLEEDGSCADEALSFFDSFVSRVAETGVAFLLGSGSTPLSLDLEGAEESSRPAWRAFIRSATVPLEILGGLAMTSLADEDLRA